MFRKMFLVLFIIVLVAGVVGFGLVPGLDPQVVTLVKVLFFILLIPFLISLFDVIGEAFRRGPRNG
jgi:uncharacterized membrane protein YtjA (UPF0391 family)